MVGKLTKPQWKQIDCFQPNPMQDRGRGHKIVNQGSVTQIVRSYQIHKFTLKHIYRIMYKHKNYVCGKTL